MRKREEDLLIEREREKMRTKGGERKGTRRRGGHCPAATSPFSSAYVQEREIERELVRERKRAKCEKGGK